MAAETQWEYRVLTLGSLWKSPSDEDLEDLLNEWGEEGWEVIGLQKPANSNSTTLLAKRPLKLSTRRRRSMPSRY